MIGDVQAPRTANWDAAGSFGGYDLRLYSLIYEPLMDYDARGQLVPALATRWERVNPLTLRVTLRQGVRFHDGSPLTAEDVKATLDRLGARDSTVPFASAFTPMHVEIRDPRTIDIVTDRPFGPLESALPVARVMSARYLADDRLLRGRPNGTGPYRLVSRNNRQTVLEANPGYWQAGKPHIKTIDFQSIQDQAAIVDALRTGSIDLMTQASPAQISTFRADDRFYLPGPESYVPAAYFYLYTQRGPLKDPRVRQAIAYAVDRDAIARSVLRGTQALSHSALPTNDVMYEPAEPSFPYDPEKAKQLLREAGYADGITIRIPTSTAHQFGPEIDQAIASYLRAVGIDAQLDRVDVGTYNAGVWARYDMTLVAWVEQTGDADFMLALFRQPLLRALFNSDDAKMNELATVQREAFGDEREAAVRAAARYAWEQQLGLFVSDFYAPEVVSTRVKGYTPTRTFGLNGLFDAWVED